MIQSTPEFQTASRSTIRKPKARLEICWTDPFIDTSILVTANDVNRGSRLFQVADTETVVPQKWLHLDGQSSFNGSFYPAPGTDRRARLTQVGWWGSNSCGANSVFNPPFPKLTLTFSERPVLYLSVSGDSAYNEYPIGFVVYLNRSNGTTVSFTVTDNDQLHWQMDISEHRLYDIVSMELEIIIWSAPQRVVKIAEFYSSIVMHYTGDDIMLLNILEEMELSNGSLPVGNISSNEIDIRLQNVDDSLFPGNTNALLHSLIKRNRRVRAWFGFELPSGEIEYKPMGVYWTGDWDTPETGTSAGTTGRDRMELLRKIDFTSSAVYQNYTLYQLAEIVCEAAVIEMPDMQYLIDNELSEFIIPWAWFTKKSYMETLRDIVASCLGYAYCDRYGVLIIGGPSRVSAVEIESDGINQHVIGGIDERADGAIVEL
jgi:hypothetical protein